MGQPAVRRATAVVRPRDREHATQLGVALRKFNADGHRTPGVQTRATRNVFIEQVLESTRRMSFPSVIGTRPISAQRRNPSSEYFDPLRAAILCARSGESEEAYWLVFLSVHFGSNRRHGWRLVRSVYGALDASYRWDWARTSTRPRLFRAWLRRNKERIRARGGSFGNHRKYESLDADSPVGTGAAIETYVNWVTGHGTHADLIGEAVNGSDGDPRAAFDWLYKEMDCVASFGRTARFDYLTNLYRLRLAAVEPGSPYLAGSTGPLRGARLLFGVRGAASELEAAVVRLAKYLNVGVHVLEDALCNWQKSTSEFVPFRG